MAVKVANEANVEQIPIKGPDVSRRSLISLFPVLRQFCPCDVNYWTFYSFCHSFTRRRCSNVDPLMIQTSTLLSQMFRCSSELHCDQ